MRTRDISSKLRKLPISARSVARIVVLVLSGAALVVCPLVWASQVQVAQAAVRAIQVTPPSAEFPTPFGEQPELASPVSDLRPGIYYDFDDGNLPPLKSKVGDDEFGYGDILGQDNLVLVWITDENGTHYLIMDKNSDDFLGFQPRDADGNPQGGRLEDDGFKYWVDQREQRVDDYNSARNQFRASGIIGVGAGLGMLICALTAGVGCIVTALGVAVAAGANQFRVNFDESQAEMKISDAERNIRGTFLDVLLTTTP